MKAGDHVKFVKAPHAMLWLEKLEGSFGMVKAICHSMVLIQFEGVSQRHWIRMDKLEQWYTARATKRACADTVLDNSPEDLERVVV